MFFKNLKKRRQFLCSGLLFSSILVHLEGTYLACYIKNLVRNLKNLVLRSKSEKNQPENG